MRVLWFSVTPSLYGESSLSHNGGGWIASLEKIISQDPSIELAIAFEHPTDNTKIQQNATTYYPINVWRTKASRQLKKYFFSKEEQAIIPRCIEIIKDFKPDIIQIFGSEWCFGLLTYHTTVPIVIHMQGCIPAYYNARFPPGYSSSSVILSQPLNIKENFNFLLDDRRFAARAEREVRILKNCKYFMGRTHWDRSITALFAPGSKYFHCDEALRDEFAIESIAPAPGRLIDNRHILVSTISSPLYKGMDLILKTAKILKEIANIPFEWRVFGLQSAGIHERLTGIRAGEVGVRIMGTVSAAALKSELLKSTAYIHPSYIDNSPNSICEAQILGIPVIATNVGGVSSLIKDGYSGVLIPSNDPFQMAHKIYSLFKSPGHIESISIAAKSEAQNRHAPESIYKQLTSCYAEVIKDCA